MAISRGESRPTASEAIVFWSWIGVLVAGLTSMIVIALSGR